jgi:hypothetical protein
MAIFDDLISSSRGPGVIGTLVALLVLVGFGTLFLFAFDDDFRGGDKSIESVIRDQGTELESLKSSVIAKTKSIEVAPERSKIALESDEVSRQTRLNKGKVSGVLAIIEKVKGETATTQKSLEDYRQHYREQVRSQAIGLKYPELKTLSGKCYKQVAISRVDAVGLAFTHADGSTRADFDDLPADIQEYFQYDVKEKERTKAAENLIAGQHAKNVELAMDAADRVQQAEMLKKSFDDKAQAKSSALAMVSRIAELDLEIQRVQDEWNRERQQVKINGGVLNSANYQTKLNNLRSTRSTASDKLQEAKTALQR